MAIDIEAPGGDEADLKAAIQALANDITVVTLSANTTLDSTYYGKIIYVDTAGVVLTFPAAPAGTEVLRVYNGSAGSITVNSAAVGTGKDILFISIGSAWKRFQPSLATSGGQPFFRDPIPGQYWNLRPFSGNGTGTALTANTIGFEPIVPTHDMTISEIICHVRTAAGASGAMAIYANSDATALSPRPMGAPIAQAGGASATFNPGTTGVKLVTLASNVTLSAGVLYWFAIHTDGATALQADGSYMTLNLLGNASAPSTAILAAAFSYKRTGTDTIGTWPTLTGFNTSPSGNNVYTPGVRIA